MVLSVGKLPENLRVFARIFYIFSGSSFRTSLFESLCCRKVKAVGHLHSATFLENVNSSWKEHFSSPLMHFCAQMHPRCKSMTTLALHAVARYIHFYLHISTGHQLKELRIMPTIKSHSWTLICPKPDSLSHDTFLTWAVSQPVTTVCIYFTCFSTYLTEP